MEFRQEPMNTMSKSPNNGESRRQQYEKVLLSPKDSIS